ncbi:hypothetical protein D3C76_193160 [compost metagenome]
MQIPSNDFEPLKGLQFLRHRGDCCSRIQYDAHSVPYMLDRFFCNGMLLRLMLACALGVVGAHKSLDLDRPAMRPLDFAFRLKKIEIAANGHLGDVEFLRKLKDRGLRLFVQYFHNFMASRSHEHSVNPPFIYAP